MINRRSTMEQHMIRSVQWPIGNTFTSTWRFVCVCLIQTSLFKACFCSTLLSTLDAVRNGKKSKCVMKKQANYYLNENRHTWRCVNVCCIIDHLEFNDKYRDILSIQFNSIGLTIRRFDISIRPVTNRHILQFSQSACNFLSLTSLRFIHTMSCIWNSSWKKVLHFRSETEAADYSDEKPQSQNC